MSKFPKISGPAPTVDLSIIRRDVSCPRCRLAFIYNFKMPSPEQIGLMEIDMYICKGCSAMYVDVISQCDCMSEHSKEFTKYRAVLRPYGK